MENFWLNLLVQFGKQLVLAGIVILLAWICIRSLSKLVTKIAEKFGTPDAAAERLIRSCCRYVIGFFALMIVLDLFGINTASLLTVLGAAGLAIGLALKDTLSNMAAGLVLLITRPYNPGDYIEGAKIGGTVIKMGLFTSTLKTPDGVFIAVPNNVLWEAPVKNYSRNDMRRADIIISVSANDDINKGIEVLTGLMNSNELIVKDPAPAVLISEITGGAVNLQLRYWTATENYWTAFWQVKGSIKSTLETAGLTIPLPQQAVKVIGGEQTK